MKRNIIVLFLLFLVTTNCAGCSSKAVVTEYKQEVVLDANAVEIPTEENIEVSAEENIEVSAEENIEVSAEENVEVEVPVENNSSSLVGDSGNINIINDGVTDSAVAGVQKYLDKIPNGYLDFIDATLIVTNNLDVGISGLFVSSENTIYIRATESSYPFTVIHEIGHLIDYNRLNPSRSSTFCEIYEKEKENFVSSVKSDWSHDISTSEEYYASAFQEFILNPDQLKENCPETYDFLHNSFNP